MVLVRQSSFWARTVGLRNTMIQRVEMTDGADECIIVHVRPRRKAMSRCGICQKRCPQYDHGSGRRCWRSLDVGEKRLYIEADAPRVCCPHHGVVTAAVPWARHDVGHTLPFEQQIAWLACHCSKSAVAELMRIAWTTVGAIITRVVSVARAVSDPFAGLRRIGIDEVSYRRGQRYVTVVVNHDTGKVIYCAPGRDRATLDKFFSLVGPERCDEISLVSADAGSWIAEAVEAHCRNAKLCIDPFHVVSWGTDALDAVRRGVWNQARRSGQKAVAQEVKGARWALWRNPEDLTAAQEAKLADIARSNWPLYRAYLLCVQRRSLGSSRWETGRGKSEPRSRPPGVGRRRPRRSGG